MRRIAMSFSVLVLLVAVVHIPANAQSPSPAAPPALEPGRAAQMPPETPPLTERQKMEVKGDLYMARKQYAEAIGVYQLILQDEPKNAQLLNKIGIAYHQMTKLDQAKKYYERAIKADRTFASAMNNLGSVEYNRKRYRAAVNHYRRALELAPNMATAHSNLGYAYFMQKKYEESMASFQRALALDPEIFEHRGGTGSVLQDRSVADRAFFYFFLAKSYALQGNAERCAHYLRKARDEGYKGLATASTDPAFAKVIDDPLVQEALTTSTSVATVPALKPEP